MHLSISIFFSHILQCREQKFKLYHSTMNKNRAISVSSLKTKIQLFGSQFSVKVLPILEFIQWIQMRRHDVPSLVCLLLLIINVLDSILQHPTIRFKCVSKIWDQTLGLFCAYATKSLKPIGTLLQEFALCLLLKWQKKRKSKTVGYLCKTCHICCSQCSYQQTQPEC